MTDRVASIDAEAAAIERLQAELTAAIAACVPRDGTALPPFDPAALPGWRTRAIELLDFYRRTVLRDSDYTPGTVSREAIDTARDFPVDRGQRRIEDHEGAPDDPRRAYLLDVMPKQRFALGSGGVMLNHVRAAPMSKRTIGGSRAP